MNPTVVIAVNFVNSMIPPPICAWVANLCCRNCTIFQAMFIIHKLLFSVIFGMCHQEQLSDLILMRLGWYAKFLITWFSHPPSWAPCHRACFVAKWYQAQRSWDNQLRSLVIIHKLLSSPSDGVDWKSAIRSTRVHPSSSGDRVVHWSDWRFVPSRPVSFRISRDCPELGIQRFCWSRVRIYKFITLHFLHYLVSPSSAGRPALLLAYYRY